MGLAHRARQAVAEALVVPAELAVLVGPLTVGGVVFLPEQLQRHPFAFELLVHVRVLGVRVLLALHDLGEQQPLEGGVIQILRQRPAEALLDRPLHVIAHRALGDAGGRRDPLVTQSRLELQAQYFFDLAHGTPLGWHRRSPRTKSGSLASVQGSSANLAGSFRRNVTGHSGIVTGDSGHKPKIGHLRAERAVTFGRNGRSPSGGISGHDGPEYARSRACCGRARNHRPQYQPDRPRGKSDWPGDRAEQSRPAGATSGLYSAPGLHKGIRKGQPGKLGDWT